MAKIKKVKRLRKLRKPRRPGKRKTGITWSAIKKANKKRKASSLELKFYEILDREGIVYKKEKCIGRCHVDIFIEPDLAVELQGCWFHKCLTCFPDPSKRDLAKIRKDLARLSFFRAKGFRVLELWEHEVNNDPSKALQKLKDMMKSNE